MNIDYLAQPFLLADDDVMLT